ncbi:MFS transporter [Suttonella sp. R2A3]|uniref:MFS transporter n=1 Tax=Suttonella sp. R2A3 TaxID=2908648 RepID=UPI001F1F392A|nr:MFS transporter [Suttonella sp. R2A3]UJF24803.1 MFS transporter [Suttonella sp. R2A3]
MQQSSVALFRTQWPLMGRIFLLGMMSGYPQIFVFSLVAVWLKDAGYSLSAITAFGAISLFYAFNWTLAPLLDRYRALGLDRRRFWLISMQAIMLLACLVAAMVNAQAALWALVVATLILTFCSALQDVAIDALRIELTPKDRNDLLSMGAGFATAGWYTGFSLGGALGLEIVDALKQQAVPVELAWRQVYLYMSGFFVLAMILSWRLYRPSKQASDEFGVDPQTEQFADIKQWFQSVFLRPFKALFSSHGVQFALMLLLFVFLFKLGEAFLGRTAIVFYKDIGFSDSEISRYGKIIGWVVMMVLSMFSGVIAARMGSWKALMFGGIAMAATNVLFAVLAWIGPKTWFLAFSVVADQITTAFATVAFVVFISTLCTDRRFTGTQYALLASLASFSRMLLASSSGYVKEHWLNDSWVLFFIITALMVIPSLVLLYFMRDRVVSIERPGDS